jgi:hypothetical protein
MIRSRLFRSRIVILGLLGAFSFLILPKDGLAQIKTGSMTGFVFGADKTTPVESAVVKVRNVTNGHEYQSLPTDKTGLYSVKNLPEGRYILGVSGAKGDFNFDYELLIKGGEIAKLAVALTPMAAKPHAEDGQSGPKKAFFLTPLGIAVLVAAGGLLIYGGIRLFTEGDASASRK